MGLVAPDAVPRWAAAALPDGAMSFEAKESVTILGAEVKINDP